MKINNILKNELKEQLVNIFPDHNASKLVNFNQLPGADTTTFEFSLLNTENKSINFILRVFRTITDRAEREFLTLQKLEINQVSVPKPFFWKKSSPAIKRSYLVMEKIPGNILADYLDTEEEQSHKNLLYKVFIKELCILHNFDWRKHFPLMKCPDLNENPYIFVERVIQRPKDLIKQYKISELNPLIEWLEINKVKCDRFTLLHGDYHMNNVIITPNEKLVVIDWADIKLGDYRYDLAFSIVTTSSAGEEVTDQFISFYESFSGQKVKEIEYFMILSILPNIMRCYSCILNPEMTNETNTTKRMFLVEYKTYTQYITQLTKQITGITLKSLEEALSE